MTKEYGLVKKAAQLNAEMDNLIKKVLCEMPLSSLGDATDEELGLMRDFMKLYDLGKELMLTQYEVLEQINSKLDKLIEK